jgi:plastocyanin
VLRLLLAAGLALPTAAAPPSGRVTIKALTYTPPVITVGAGGRVTWSFEDGDIPHTVTADDNSFGSPPSGQKTGTFEHLFSAKGTVNYHCDFHPNMFGTVNVR